MFLANQSVTLIMNLLYLVHQCSYQQYILKAINAGDYDSLKVKKGKINEQVKLNSLCINKS